MMPVALMCGFFPVSATPLGSSTRSLNRAHRAATSSGHTITFFPLRHWNVCILCPA
jgi:hypothetical protein